MQDDIRSFLRDNYGLQVQSIQRMSIGVGGDTFRVGSVYNLL